MNVREVLVDRSQAEIDQVEPDAADGMGTGPQRKSIQSVEIGARVLEALVDSDKEGAHLREVAEKARLSRSQAHRYLLAFVNTGVVEQDLVSGRYALGAFAIRIGMAALARVEPVQVAGRYLSVLLGELKTTGLLSVWGNYGPTVVRWIDGGIPLYTTLHTGSVLPLQTSSTGILFLAFCPRAQTDSSLASERAAGLSVPDDELERLMTEARECGFTRTFGTVVPGLSAVSAPVFDADRRLVATMSVLARTQDKDFYSARRIEKIRLQALEASRAIGWSG
jgi:DNA-binding IclR family transcriptional regulator